MMLNDLIKKRNRNLIIYVLLGFVGMLAPLIPGAILLETDPNAVFGIVLVILSILIFVSATVWLCIVSTKINNEINKLKIQSDIEKLSTFTENKIFKSIEGRTFEFNDEFFLIDNKIQYYNKYSSSAAFRVDKGMFIPCLVIGETEGKEQYTIDLDGDLLRIIKDSNITILNKEELEFYIDNIESATKQVAKSYSFNPMPCFIMEFKKNKQDAKKFTKRTLISILFSIVFFALVIGFNVLIIWLTDSKEGIEASNKIGMDIIIKIIFSIILVLLVFVKAKKYSIYTKIIIGLYLTIFWWGRLYFNDRNNILVDYLFMIVFILCGIFESYRIYKEEKNVKNCFNRYYGIAIFLLFVQMFTAFDLTFKEEGKPWLVALFIDIFLFLIALYFIVLYLVKNKDKTKKEKGIFIGVSVFWALVGGYYLSIISLINLNYSLDKSIPIINSYEIVELENGDDNESDKATVIINGTEYRITIADEEYHELSVGDMLEVYYFEGAFNIAYYIHYSK